MLVLAGVSINAIIGDNGIITNAQNASIMSKLSSYKEKLEIESVNGQVDGYSVTVAGEDIKKYLPDMKDEEIKDYAIVNNKLIYIGTDEAVKVNAEKLGIEVKDASEVDIIFVNDFVNELIADVGEDETQYIGTKLLTKEQKNETTWIMVIDYNDFNQVLGRYGTGWYLLESGTTLPNGKKTTSDFVIDYSKNDIKSLYNYEIWDINSTLAVSDNMVLNLDPINLKDGTWIANSPTEGYDGLYVGDEYQNIMRGGDVYYDDSTKSLIFDGEGDFLVNNKPGSLKDGFTFEFFAKSNGARRPIKGRYEMGIFCKCLNPFTDTNTVAALRFGLYSLDSSIADFSNYRNYFKITL